MYVPTRALTSLTGCHSERSQPPSPVCCSAATPCSAADVDDSLREHLPTCTAPCKSWDHCHRKPWSAALTNTPRGICAGPRNRSLKMPSLENDSLRFKQNVGQAPCPFPAALPKSGALICFYGQPAQKSWAVCVNTKTAGKADPISSTLAAINTEGGAKPHCFVAMKACSAIPFDGLQQGA